MKQKPTCLQFQRTSSNHRHANERELRFARNDDVISRFSNIHHTFCYKKSL